MTTIAYRDGVLAADGRTTNNGTIVSDSVTKIHARPDGSYAAITGNKAEATAFIAWLGTDKPRPDLAEGRVIVARPDSIEVYEGNGSFRLDTEGFYAWGSGAAAALTAMHLGCSAEEAVEAAKKVDCYSGGKVRTVRLDARRANNAVGMTLPAPSQAARMGWGE